MRIIEKRMSKTILFFISIIFLAGFFRLTNLNLIEYKTDEAINVFLASRPIFGHPFPSGGTVSSVGIPNPPLFNYLLFPFVIFTTDPKVLTFFIALANVIAIGFWFIFIKRYYGLISAFITSSFFALSPWAILYSRKIWAPDILLPFLIGLLWSSHEIAIKNNKKHWIPYTFLSLSLIQLHQSSLFFLVPFTFFLVISNRSMFSFRYILFGLLLGLLPLIPFFQYEIQHGCPDCSALITAEEKVAVKSSPTVFLRNLQIVGTGYYNYVFGVNDLLIFKQTYPLAYNIRNLFYINYILLPIGMSLFYKRHKKSRFLIYTTVSLSFLYYFFRIEPVMHYFIIILPLLFLFLSYPFLYFFEKKSLYLRVPFFILFVSLFISYGIFDFSFSSFLKSHKGTGGDYGPIYSETEKNIKRNTTHYLGEKNFKEMTITYLIPPSAMLNNPSLARMLYPPSETEKNMNSLENKLQKQPKNLLAEQELTAYYRQKMDTETIGILREKANKIPTYKPIYKQIYTLWLDQRFKKAFTQSGFPIVFEYPSHWTVLETFPEKIIINGDFITLSITNLEDKKEEKNLEKKVCITKEKNWCGTQYKLITLGSYRFNAALIPDKQQNIYTKNVIEAQKTADEIITSLRIKNEPL